MQKKRKEKKHQPAFTSTAFSKKSGFMYPV
jgi:hypothetical protein